MEVGGRQGKTPIFVKDVPGFFVNRCLSPFSVEVGALVMEGVGLEMLDKSMKSYGMPVGPITLSDEVGIDISYHVGQFMSKADLGVRMAGGNPEMMKAMLDKGWLGRKSGKGFYLYPANPKKGEKKQLNPEVVAVLDKLKAESGVKASKLTMEEIQFRIISRFVNEAAYCLQDGIIRSAVDGKFIARRYTVVT
jgi:enoyl-CoA hydratase / long-chain 3-hydroxyacyl-CoA dehydrogenase